MTVPSACSSEHRRSSTRSSTTPTGARAATPAEVALLPRLKTPMTSRSSVVFSVLMLACSNPGENNDDCTPGTEGCACIEDEQCVAGLVCASELCVDVDVNEETGPTADSGESTGTPAPDQDTHGFFRIEFAISAPATESPFVGTDQIIITGFYDDCLSSFYDANPTYQLFGVDGAAVFGPLSEGGEGWQDKLCDPTESGQVTCTISSFTQAFEVPPQMTVTYDAPGDPEGLFVKFGPIPLENEVPGLSCSPQIQLQPQAIRARDAAGSIIWSGESIDSGTAAPDQPSAVVVRVRSSG